MRVAVIDGLDNTYGVYELHHVEYCCGELHGRLPDGKDILLAVLSDDAEALKIIKALAKHGYAVVRLGEPAGRKAEVEV